MNVYDFDNTLLKGDSTARFFAWCLLRTPSMWRDIPMQAANGLLFLLKLKSKQAFKQRMLCFLNAIPDIDAELERFWERNLRRIKPFYADIQREDDVIISASPEFLIRPACKALHIHFVLGSPVNKRTGRFMGANCHGEEKLRRFQERFPEASIDCFYSDSHSDDPLARIAAQAFLVKGNKLRAWDRSVRQRQSLRKR